ncbi:divalent-cation tolerance protein CutA [Streptomyces sp. NPDC086023]|uniref:divalent-cation tolerance protein CutA n=1 Tax=Streptomyces sp. NPDC086023 TaxID=3365746 RepID=UPI0037D63BDB
MAEFLQVSTATEDRSSAEALARSTVSARLAAGAQIVGPVLSAFWHEGEFGTGEEWQLLFKIRADRYADLERHLLDQHPWKNPEITAVPIVAGSAAYLRWVSATTAPEAQD